MEKELIMSLLTKKGILSLSEVCNIVRCKESNLIVYLGQLIKENKIRICEHNGRFLVETKSLISEIYY